MSAINAYAALEKGGKVVPWSYEPRPLDATDVEIKISHCGVCAGDVHAIRGSWDSIGWPAQKFPVVPGHEIVGTISKVGSGVTKVKLGDRVGMGCLSWACLECNACHSGVEQRCKRAVFTYMGSYEDGAIAQGGYAEAVRVSEEFVFQIPERLASEHAAPLLCAGVTTYSPLVNHGAGPGKTVGVVGIGGLGHLAIQFANKLGAQVVAFSSSENKRDECLRLGAHKFVNTSDPDQLRSVNGTVDIMLVTANASNMPWDGYLWSMAVGGKVVTVSVPEGHL
ncbi:GroES-like protein, partial [Ramicandelaber brevisporus]